MLPQRQRLAPDSNGVYTELPDAPSLLDSVLDNGVSAGTERISILDSVIAESDTPLLLDIVRNEKSSRLASMKAEIESRREAKRHAWMDRREYAGCELSEVAETDHGRRQCVCGSYSCNIGPFIVR